MDLFQNVNRFYNYFPCLHLCLIFDVTDDYISLENILMLQKKMRYTFLNLYLD